MGADIPKQFLLLNGKPIIFRTIQKFIDFDENIEVIVVLPSNQIHFYEQLCKEHDFNADCVIVEGGAERFYSVKNGLQKCKGELIAVHDAVRPLVSIEVIRACFEDAKKTQASIPVVSINESIRRIVDGKSSPRNRDDFRIVQTPQCFDKNVLLNAYNQSYQTSYTDDASVVESAGQEISLVEGNHENIKITRKVDLQIAEKIWE